MAQVHVTRNGNEWTRLNLVIHKDQRAYLRETAAKKDCTISDILRDLIDKDMGFKGTYE